MVSMFLPRLHKLGLIFVLASTSFAQCELHALDEVDDRQPPTTQTPQPNATQTDPALAQPKRILGIMPNYRAVSAGEQPPPPTAREAFKIATKQSFDYSAFIFVGVTSLMAEVSDSHPQLGEGIKGFGRYYWRGFVDKMDGNYLVIFALPTVLREDATLLCHGKGRHLEERDLCRVARSHHAELPWARHVQRRRSLRPRHLAGHFRHFIIPARIEPAARWR